MRFEANTVAEWTALAATVAGADCFALLDAARSFDPDDGELRRRFLDIHRRVHPDALAGESEAVQAVAMQIASRVNEAYETLRDPIRRAECLLALAGGKTAAQDRRVPQEALNQALMLREEIDAARQAGDEAALAEIRRGVLEQKGRTEARIGELARRVAAGPTDADRDELRLLLNAMKYVENLASQL